MVLSQRPQRFPVAAEQQREVSALLQLSDSVLTSAGKAVAMDLCLHLTRHFHAVTGTTPLQWLLAQRIRRAQELLETTDDSVEGDS